MTSPRRFLVLLALLFWQGGFTFYASVVVPLGTEVLGSAEAQGWVTRRVTNALNLSGLAALAVLGWDLALSRDPDARRRRLRWLAWGLLAATLAVLVGLHLRLDALLDAERRQILDRPAFRGLHRWYLWVSTLQWACGLLAAWWTLRAWQGEDRRRADPTRPG
jgi:hypothetical protein